jgi:hypothetical protein
MWCPNRENNHVHEWRKVEFIVYCTSCDKARQYAMPKGKGLLPPPFAALNGRMA